MAINKLSQFLGERTHTMMLFLIRNISRHVRHIRLRDRERAIASAPREFSRHDVMRVNPVGRASLKKLHQFFYRNRGRKIHKRMNVIRIHVVDFYVNAFAFGVLVQVARYTFRSRFAQ